VLDSHDVLRYYRNPEDKKAAGRVWLTGLDLTVLFLTVLYNVCRD
jgi:hypothetical protein